MAHKLTEKECRQKFEMFDGNLNEKISFKELERLLQYFGYNPTTEDVVKCMKDMGKTGNDEIEFPEFYEYFRNLPDPFQELHDSFKFFDKDNNGYLDKNEFRKILTSGSDMTDKELDELFRLVDTNGDQKIDYKEFAKLFSEMNE